MVTLCFTYTHQHAVPVGTYDENHIKLADLCLDHLRSLSDLEDDPYYPWDCFPDAVNAGYELAEVSVNLPTHRPSLAHLMIGLTWAQGSLRSQTL